MNGSEPYPFYQGPCVRYKRSFTFSLCRAFHVFSARRFCFDVPCAATREANSCAVVLQQSINLAQEPRQRVFRSVHSLWILRQSLRGWPAVCRSAFAQGHNLLICSVNSLVRNGFARLRKPTCWLTRSLEAACVVVFFKLCTPQ